MITKKYHPEYKILSEILTTLLIEEIDLNAYHVLDNTKENREFAILAEKHFDKDFDGNLDQYDYQSRIYIPNDILLRYFIYLFSEMDNEENLNEPK